MKQLESSVRTIGRIGQCGSADYARVVNPEVEPDYDSEVCFWPVRLQAPFSGERGVSTDLHSAVHAYSRTTARFPVRIGRRDRIFTAGNAEGSLASEKELAAEEVLDAKARFGMALSNKRKYPVDEFHIFARAARNYIRLTAGDALIHRKVAGEISGLGDYLRLERNVHVPISGLYGYYRTWRSARPSPTG